MTERERMMKYINDTLEDASDSIIGELYWFLKIELGD